VATTARKLRQTPLREGVTPFDRLPWGLQGFVVDFLRCHQCEVTPANCQAVADAVEQRLKRGPLCRAQLLVRLEDDVFFD